MSKVRNKSTLLVLFTFLLQGCGSSGSSSSEYATSLGDGVSIGVTDKGAVMVPNTNTVKAISQEVGAIVKTNVSDYNNKEAIEFSKEINYCDISGIKEANNNGDMELVTSNQTFEACQEENLQNGKINIDYSQLNSDGKYPMTLDMSISEEYTFNTTQLKKDLVVNSNIVYNTEKEIQQIQLKINGELNFDGQNYVLQNISQTIDY